MTLVTSPQISPRVRIRKAGHQRNAPRLENEHYLREFCDVTGSVYFLHSRVRRERAASTRSVPGGL